MIRNKLDKLIASLSAKEQEATFLVLRKIYGNIIQQPSDEKYRQIKLTDESFTSKVWQYPAGEELMKMSGWIMEGDHVTELRLRDDSCVHIVSQLLNQFTSTSAATGVVPFQVDEFQVLITALYNGDITCIQKLLKVSHISPNGRIYSESGSSLNLLPTTTIAQQLDVVKLLLTDYSVNLYYISIANNLSVSYFETIFYYAPQSFIVSILKYCGVTAGYEVKTGLSIFSLAVITNCFDVICFLLEGSCDSKDVNATDDSMRTPLHLAYLYGHTQIAQHLIQHGADEYAVDQYGHTPYEYIDGHPDFIKDSEYLQNRRKIHHIPYSIEHCFFMKIINNGIDDEEAVSLTMEQFPSLKEDGPTQPHHDIDHASALKEFTQYITNTTERSTWNTQPLEMQKGGIKVVRDYPHQWTPPLTQRKYILF